MTRTTSLTAFSKLLSIKIMALRKSELWPDLRIVRIDASQAGGDITIMVQSEAFYGFKSFLYRADGTFSNLAWWCEDQI
jgi:hypothetical protein